MIMNIRKEAAGQIVQLLEILTGVELTSEENDGHFLYCQGAIQGDLVEIFEEFFRRIEEFFKNSPTLSLYKEEDDRDRSHLLELCGGTTSMWFVYGYHDSFTRMDFYSGKKRKMCVIVDKEKIFISD